MNYYSDDFRLFILQFLGNYVPLNGTESVEQDSKIINNPRKRKEGMLKTTNAGLTCQPV